MDKSIVKYLRENKDKHSKEILVNELLKSGYGQPDIEEGVKVVYKDKDAATPLDKKPPGSFWDFKAFKAYRNNPEKIKDFLFGFFTPWLVAFIPIVGFISILIEIFLIIYLFNRRRYIAYGVISYIVFVVILLLLLFIFVLKMSRH